MAAFTNVRQVALQELAVLGSALLPINILAEACVSDSIRIQLELDDVCWQICEMQGASESPNDGRAGG